MKPKPFSSRLADGAARARRVRFVDAARSVGVVAAEVAEIVGRLQALDATMPDRDQLIDEAAQHAAAGKPVPDQVGARFALIEARHAVLLQAENRLVGELKAAIAAHTDEITAELDGRLDGPRDLFERAAEDLRWQPGQPLGEVALISGDLAATVVRLPEAVRAAEAVEKTRSELFGGVQGRSKRALPQGARPHALLLPTDLSDRDPSEPLGLTPHLSIESVVRAYREGSATLRVPSPGDLEKAVSDICAALDRRAEWAAARQPFRGGMRLMGGPPLMA